MRAQAFGALGDDDVARQCVRIAEQLAAERGDGGAADRVRAVAGRFADRHLGWAP